MVIMGSMVLERIEMRREMRLRCARQLNHYILIREIVPPTRLVPPVNEFVLAPRVLPAHEVSYFNTTISTRICVF